MIEEEFTITVFDDASVRKKITVMSLFEACLDDSRNTDVPNDLSDRLDEGLEFGKSYRVKISIEEQ